MIVTNNVRDFPAAVIDRLGLTTVRVEDFLLDQFDLDPVATCRIIAEQAAAAILPPLEIGALLEQISRSGAPRFAKNVGAQLEGKKSPPTQ